MTNKLNSKDSGNCIYTHKPPKVICTHLQQYDNAFHKDTKNNLQANLLKSKHISLIKEI